MHITIPRRELKEAVAGLSRIVPRRVTLPVLQTIRLAVDSGRTTMTGTDLDQVASYQFEEAKAEGDGAVLIDLQDADFGDGFALGRAAIGFDVDEGDAA